MKKILAIILALASLFAFASCDNGEQPGEITGEVDGVEVFAAMIAESVPKKSDITFVTSIGNIDFGGTETLVTGKTATGETATVQTYEYDTLLSLKKGSAEEILPVIGDTVKGSREYLEGKGERINGGSWDAEGVDFAPSRGSIPINLDPEYIENVSYTASEKTRILMFTVPKDKASEVFKSEFSGSIDLSGASGDITVVLKANTAVITGITISYTSVITSNLDKDIVFPDAKSSITVTYSYVTELVTLTR